MLPAGLLIIIALGIVAAYVLPQRIKERSDYAMVRTEDRFSADMRVVKATADRVGRPLDRASSDSGEVPLLVTGAARAAVAAVSTGHMSRPATALDRAATLASREQLALRKARHAITSERAAQARRRASVALASLLLAVTAWVLVGFAVVNPLVAAGVTALFVGVVAMGARAAAIERRIDARNLPVVREVEAVATATQALRRVTRERAQGHQAEPSNTETQAIAIVTSDDIKSRVAEQIAAEEPLSKPVAPVVTPARVPWTPPAMPAPAYTLKASVPQQQARPLTDEDLAGSSRGVEQQGAAQADAQPRETRPSTAALDTILARRRASA